MWGFLLRNPHSRMRRDCEEEQMAKRDSISFTDFLRRQRQRLVLRWDESEARIREAKSVGFSLEIRKAGGVAPLVNGPGIRSAHRIGGGYGGQYPAVFGIDDRETNEGWH